MTGLLSVNNITEFVYLVEQIINASLYRNKNIKNPSVVALVGPSGSGKTALSDSLCAMEQFENPKTYCTKPGDKHRYLTEDESMRRISLKRQGTQEYSMAPKWRI